MLSIPQLVSRYGVISFFETPLNLTISFVYIFSRGFKQRISSELDGYFPIVQLICSRHVLIMETMMLSKLEISSTHNFGVCTNVSCTYMSQVLYPTSYVGQYLLSIYMYVHSSFLALHLNQVSIYSFI